MIKLPLTGILVMLATLAVLAACSEPAPNTAVTSTPATMAATSSATSEYPGAGEPDSYGGTYGDADTNSHNRSIADHITNPRTYGNSENGRETCPLSGSMTLGPCAPSYLTTNSPVSATHPKPWPARWQGRARDPEICYSDSPFASTTKTSLAFSSRILNRP